METRGAHVAPTPYMACMMPILVEVSSARLATNAFEPAFCVTAHLVIVQSRERVRQTHEERVTVATK